MHLSGSCQYIQVETHQMQTHLLQLILPSSCEKSVYKPNFQIIVQNSFTIHQIAFLLKHNQKFQFHIIFQLGDDKLQHV